MRYILACTLVLAGLFAPSQVNAQKKSDPSAIFLRSNPSFLAAFDRSD